MSLPAPRRIPLETHAEPALSLMMALIKRTQQGAARLA